MLQRKEIKTLYCVFIDVTGNVRQHNNDLTYEQKQLKI